MSMAGLAAEMAPVKISGAMYFKLPALLLSDEIMLPEYRPLIPKSTI